MAGILDALTPTTIANYARGSWDGVSQNNPFFSELKKRGRIKYDVGGDQLVIPVEMGRYTPIVSAPGMDLSSQFAPKVRHKQASFPWGEITNATVLDRGLLRRNSGDQALVRLKDTEIPALMRDAIIGTNGLAHQLLQQNGPGYTGAGLPFYGAPSFLHAPGATGLVGFDGISTATGIAVADTDIEATFSSTSATYGGLSMERSALTGVDGLEPDAWTSTLVNTSYTGWTGTADQESLAMLLAMQYAVNRACRFSNSDPNKKPTFGTLDFSFFSYAGALIAAKQTIYVQSEQKNAMTPNLGYGQFELMHAGIKWFWDENAQASSGIIWNLNQCELNIQPLYKDQEGGSPLKVSGEDAGIMESNINFDPLRRLWLISATIPGQFAANPRYFVRLGNYS